MAPVTVDDRRRPERQRPRFDPGAKRATDPVLALDEVVDELLTTAQCAKVIGGDLSVDYVMGEIHDGRLIAHIKPDSSGKPMYRVSRADLALYISKRGWVRVPKAG